MPHHSQWDKDHRPSPCLHLSTALLETCCPHLSPDLFSRCSLISLYFCGIAVSTVVLVSNAVIMHHQWIRPNNGLGLVCSCRPYVNKYARYAAISWGFWRPMTLTFDPFNWKLAFYLLMPWGTFITSSIFFKLQQVYKHLYKQVYFLTVSVYQYIKQSGSSHCSPVLAFQIRHKIWLV